MFLGLNEVFGWRLLGVRDWQRFEKYDCFKNCNNILSKLKPPWGPLTVVRAVAGLDVASKEEKRLLANLIRKFKLLLNRI